eukprot:UN32752
MTAIAVDEGYFHYNDLVTKHWPEFGQNGKENLKIEDIMRHEAGLSNFNHQRFDTDIATYDDLAKAIENSPSFSHLNSMTRNERP